MKKFRIIVIFLFCSLLLVGCSTEENPQITTLENELIALEEELVLLETAIYNLETTATDYEDRIAYLEAQRSTLRTQIQDLERRVGEMETVKPNEIQVFLADKYYLVPNENFQLFYRSVIRAVDPYRYYIKLEGTVGHAYNRYYEFMPTATDNGKTYTLTLSVCDDNGNELGTKTTSLIVSGANSTAPTKNILCIGDSLTANGYWVSRGSGLYQSAGGGVINLLGTITGGYGTTVHYEGRGGWQWSSFVSGYGSVPSPFKKTTGTGISFLDYCTRNGYTHIDELYILMTWNGIGGSFRTFSMLSEPFVSAKALIDQFHSDFPSGKVTLLGIPQPSVHAGLGAYYTINQSYGDNYGQFVTALNYNQQLEAFAKSATYATFMRYVDVKGQFDSEYNMPTESKPVNNQNSATEPVGNAMGMHPTTAGYLQIGDVFYRALCQEWEG